MNLYHCLSFLSPGFYSQLSQSFQRIFLLAGHISLIWASMAENGSISPWWNHTNCGWQTDMSKSRRYWWINRQKYNRDWDFGRFAVRNQKSHSHSVGFSSWASHLKQTGSPPCFSMLTTKHIFSSPPSHQLGTRTPFGHILFMGASPARSQNQTKQRLSVSGYIQPALAQDSPENNRNSLTRGWMGSVSRLKTHPQKCWINGLVEQFL